MADIRKKASIVAMAALLLGTAINAAAPSSAENTSGCEPRKFFVAPNGSDRDPGTKDEPWKTIEHARDEVRRVDMDCDVVVNIRAGDYVVDETVSFDEFDSGRNGHQVIYRSYDGPGKARFLGGRQVGGWQQYDGDIYRAKIADKRDFYTLFENGKRATNARHPNRRTDTEWAPYLKSRLREPEKEAVHQWLGFFQGDLKPGWEEDIERGQAKATVWSGGSWSWFTDTIPLGGIDFEDNFMTLKYWARYSFHNSGGGSRYFLENSLHFLDEAGEYYYDFENSMLYYWPRSDSIEDANIVAPTVDTVFSLAGSSEQHPVHDITFDGLAVQYSDFVDWYRYGWISAGDSGYPQKYPEYDRQIEMPRNQFGAITLTNSQDIDLRRMRISDTGFTAIFLLFANDHVRVSDSLLENIGGDGIKVEGPWPGDGDVAHHNTFTNNVVDHYGELVPGDAAGVELMNTGYNTVSHSIFNHSARYGVSLEVRPEVRPEDNYAHNNVFEYLRIDQAGLDSGDMGAFYTYGVSNVEPAPIDNHVSQVLIGDVIPDPSMPDSGTRGVHMDAGGCGFAFENIEVGEVTDDKYQSYDCNRVRNANWQDDFDPSEMEYDKIGVTEEFPYPVPAR